MQDKTKTKKGFSRDVKFYKEYIAFMDDILKKDYAVKLSDSQRKEEPGICLIRHPVKQKLRVVFRLGCKLSRNIAEPATPAGTGPNELTSGGPHEVPTRQCGGYGCGGHVPSDQSQQ